MPPSESSKIFTIAICGGGIGGLSFAIGLHRHGIPFHLYEAANAFAEIGAGVSFGPNSLRAMTLIDPKIKEGYDRRSTTNQWDEKKDCWFDFRYGMDGINSKAGEWFHSTYAPGTGQNSVHRAHFLDELVKLIPEGNVSFGKKVEKMEQIEDGVKMIFHDGTTATASAVVGCDGIKSNVRPILLGKRDPAARAVFTGKYAYRGLIPMVRAVDLLGDELARNSQMYCGYGGHVLTFPIEKGKTMNVVAFQTKEDGKWEDERWVLPTQKKDMEADFARWGHSVKSILSLMEKPDVWALFDHPPARTYWKGRICLLGDSAHASTPHQGAGAGMALEDAYVLTNLLGKVQKSSEIEKAFRAYDLIRRVRTQRLVTTSREAGLMYDFQGEAIGDDVLEMKKSLDHRYDWIWSENLEKELQEALQA
jgi:salicylate hydroxylase